MKQETLQNVATALGALTDPAVRKLAEYWASGIPDDHWIRTRRGLFLISMIRDHLRGALREIEDPLTCTVLLRMVRLMNFLFAALDRD